MRDIEQIRIKLEKVPHNFYIEYVLNIYLILGDIRQACLLEFSDADFPTIGKDVFIPFIVSKGLDYYCVERFVYVMKPGIDIPRFSSDSHDREMGLFLGYPQAYVDDFQNAKLSEINVKYKYYILLSIDGQVYDLYRMAAGSKKNLEARKLENNCHKYFTSLCPNSHLIYGYTKRSIYMEFFN